MKRLTKFNTNHIDKSKYPKVSHPKVYVSYLIFVVIGVWVDSYAAINIAIDFMSHLIPSISTLSNVANNPVKAEFEIVTAWLFSIIIPFLSFNKLDWEFIENRHKKMGGPLIPMLVLLICGSLVLLMLAVPLTPSSTRRGMLISMWFKHNVAFVWGCAIILVAGLAWSFIAMAGILFYRKFIKNGLFK